MTQGIGPQTRLGKIAAGAADKAAPAESVSASSSRLRRTLAGGRRGEEVDLPVLGRAWIELPGARAWQEIEAAVAAELRRLERGELGNGSLATAAAAEAELAMRVCAIAVRDPDDHARPFGTLEEWGEVDNDVLSIVWHAFGDIRQRLDPVDSPLSEEDMIAIGVAVKKNDAALLRTFGVVKLSRWLATTGDPRSISQQPSSPNSDSQSAKSESSTQS